MFTDKIIYLAGPYTHRLRSIREKRFVELTLVAAILSKKRIPVFSPITHSHCMTDHYDIGGKWEFWGHIDKQFLQRSDEIWVLRLKGWDKSTGVKAELNYAKRLGLPIKYVDFDIDTETLNIVDSKGVKYNV